VAQATNLNEVDAAVAALDRDTQQNAAMAEQSSAASELLRQEVTRLSQRTAVFCRGGAEPERQVDLRMYG
jgi:methyl-accepting chemotaxis protein